jgi:hypothetical protein
MPVAVAEISLRSQVPVQKVFYLTGWYMSSWLALDIDG